MSNVHGYSLWLVPDTNSEAYRALARCIADISKKYQTPDFVPHATLLGSVGNTEKDMRANTQELAGELAPYEIRLDEIGSNRTYFQILFSKIEQTEAVMRANTIAQKVFVIDQGTYLPHLSLAYGDLSPEQIALLKQMQINARNAFVNYFRIDALMRHLVEELRARLSTSSPKEASYR